MKVGFDPSSPTAHGFNGFRVSYRAFCCESLGVSSTGIVHHLHSLPSSHAGHQDTGQIEQKEEICPQNPSHLCSRHEQSFMDLFTTELSKPPKAISVQHSEKPWLVFHHCMQRASQQDSLYLAVPYVFCGPQKELSLSGHIPIPVPPSVPFPLTFVFYHSGLGSNAHLPQAFLVSPELCRSMPKCLPLSYLSFLFDFFTSFSMTCNYLFEFFFLNSFIFWNVP